MKGPLFITFEGIDGSGKSTQAGLLARHLEDAGLPVTRTREPGGSPGAEEIRTLLVRGDPGRWSPEAEILLFTAARRDHLERTIQPALSAGQVVVCDRFIDSTRAYQSAAHPELRAKIDQLHELMIGIEPDLTLIIDMNPAQALARGLARAGVEHRFENKGLALQEAVREGYLAIARAAPERCVVIDGNRDKAAIAADVAAVVTTRLRHIETA